MNIIQAEEFYLHSCCHCGVRFLIPDELDDSLRQCKNTFYCPNGHAQSYTKSTAELLREELNKKQSALNSVTVFRDIAVKRAEKAEKALDKLKKSMK